ncbi:unnamed protein product [Lactuca virosa]|uniref:Uncharacterized protein n=1 Tax=Lactuca virosa TaxID=75947 RepID=A0AAU9NSG8_9ASTR|nr:unnamed protein product [Lactuca virosa]
MANKEALKICTIKSRLSRKTLVDIVKKYHIYPDFRLCLCEPGNAIVDALEGFVGVYRVFFKSWLCLLAFDFLEEIFDYYHLHITQITPKWVSKNHLICDVMLYI